MRAARDLPQTHRSDYATACAEFGWPRPEYNFALGWFDGVLAAEHPDRTALKIIEMVRSERGLTIRDGFGQTESCLQVGNPRRDFS